MPSRSTFETAGLQSITADDVAATVSSTSPSVSISAAAFDKFGFIGLGNGTAGTAQTVTVEAEDAYGNEVSSFTGTVDLSSSDPHLTGLPASYDFTSPTHAFTITFETAGSQSITANDPAVTISSTSSPVSISPGALGQFAFNGLTGVTAGTAQTITVEAEDQFGNELSSFSGTVDFSSSDAQLSGLPVSYAFTAPEHPFTITFETAGSQSITADDVAATISSTSPAVSISAGVLEQFAFKRVDRRDGWNGRDDDGGGRGRLRQRSLELHGNGGFLEL